MGIPPTPAFGHIRGPIVDKEGNVNPVFARLLTQWQTQLSAGLNQIGVIIGQIAASAKIQGRAEGIGTTVTNIDATGKVQAPGVGFNLTAVPDGTARKAVLEVDVNQRPLIDFSQATHVAKNSDNIPSGATTIIPTQTRMNAATDVNGNLLLKNIQQAVASTSNPTTTSSSFVDLAEMTLTFTTKGNVVYLSFCVSAGDSATGGTVFFVIVRDSGAASSMIAKITSYTNGAISSASITWQDQPPAGSHTYKVQWSVSSTTTGTCDGTNRMLQATELG